MKYRKLLHKEIDSEDGEEEQRLMEDEKEELVEEESENLMDMKISELMEFNKLVDDFMGMVYS